MERSPAPESIAVVVIASILLLTGPVIGVVSVGGESPSLGDGSATVATASLDGDATIDRGRFGTGVFYVRPPAADLVVTDVADAPRLVYRLGIRRLSYETTATRPLASSGSGRYRLAPPDDGISSDRIDSNVYVARIAVAVQSLSDHEVVFRQRVIVRVRR